MSVAGQKNSVLFLTVLFESKNDLSKKLWFQSNGSNYFALFYERVEWTQSGSCYAYILCSFRFLVKDCIKSLCDNLFMSSSIIRTSYFDNRLAGCLFSSAGYVYAMLCFHFNTWSFDTMQVQFHRIQNIAYTGWRLWKRISDVTTLISFLDFCPMY